MNFIIAFICTFVLCWITIPTLLVVLGAINFYTTVMEGRCKVYILFGRVIGVITEPGLHLLWLRLGPQAVLADAHDIDIIAIQEGAPKKQVDSLVGPDWESIVTQEAPFAKRIGNETVPPSVGVKRFNVLLKRADATDIDLIERAYTLETSQKFKDEFIGTPVEEPGKRVRKPKVDLSKVNKLGVRRPQNIELTMPGHMAVSFYNYHAPQGSGSAQGYSGMDAPIGHEILSMVIDEDNTPYKMVIGDQNAYPDSMEKHYPKPFKILSATTSPTELVHAAIPRGLNPQPIDLGQDGIDFNNKGQAGCSDHPPQAFKVTLPSST